MRLTSLFGLYATVFVLLVAILTGLTLRNIEQSNRWDERSELANASLQEHLLLQSKVFQLLKQYGDALIIGDRDQGAGERDLTQRLSGAIARIRGIIGAEIELVGDEEIEELELLAEIERKIAEVTRGLRRLTFDNPTPEQVEQLADLLDQTIDVELTNLIQAAVEEEQEEVAETRAEATAFRDNMRKTTWAVGAAAFLVLVAGVWSYFYMLHLPFKRLMSVVRTYGLGDFSRDATQSGGLELKKMSGVLSEMAAMLRQREIEQKQQSEVLEYKVKERTTELQHLLKQIELSESNRRRMMADISHELRTPLTIIRGEAEVALRGKMQDVDESSDTLARIRDAARHTTQIVDDMLLVARHEAGELRLDPKDVDLRQIIADARDLFGAPIAVEIDAQDTFARVDPLRMRQCLLSVLHNAQRYGGPQIDLHLHDTANGLILTVSDDGPGMSAQDKDQAFERFFRGSNAAQIPKEGTGLGLPIVRAIMEAHGGTATLEDAASGGLAVVLTIPRKKPLLVVEDGETLPKSNAR